MRKNGGASYLGLAVIILLVIAILYVGISALQDQHVYQREAAITPTPSITPRTVRITEDPALPTSTPTPCILQKNSIGIEVKQLQQRLKDLGYYSGDVDGQYGTGTQTAVTAFQAQHGLKADGVAGEQTLAILYSESAQTFVPTPTPSATPAMPRMVPEKLNFLKPTHRSATNRNSATAAISSAACWFAPTKPLDV